MPCSDCSPAFTALIKLKECKLLSTARPDYIPFASKQTRAELNELVAHAEKELMKYRDTVARLQEMIVTLENEKENLKRQVQRAKSLMAPIRKLPPELLGKIFIDHGITNLLDCSLGEADIPGFKLASVCSRWRSVAIDTPGLWNNISLDLKGKRQVSCIALMENLLKLSAKYKLNITINATADACVPACLALLCDQADRWQSLDGTLVGRNAPLLKALLSIQRRLDSLQKCSLYAPFKYYSAWVEGARNLHTAGVFDIDPASNIIPWGQIVDLTVLHPYPPSIAASLANLHNLRTLKVDSPRMLNTRDPNYSLQDPVHSDLRSLKFVIKNSDEEIHMSKLLKVLVLPKLQSFSIVAESHKTNQDDSHWSSKELPSLISRSSALITTFDLDQVWVPTSDLITLLTSMPALATLFLSEPSLSYGEEVGDTSSMLNDQLLSTLHYQRNRPILTRLTSLILKECQLEVFSIHLFVKVVHSRWKPSVLEEEVACIQTVALQAANGISIPWNAVQTLMMLRSRGLDILLEDENGEVPLWEED